MRWRWRRRPLGTGQGKQVAVIGLGRFGMSLGRALVAQGHEVLGIDAGAGRVADAADVLTHAVQADSTDERVLRELDLQEFDGVMLAIGEDVESSVSTALLLKEIGVSRVWAKARDHRHRRMLELIGVERVVLPEHEMGQHVATLITSETLLDYFELTGEHSIAEVVVGSGFADQTLRVLDLRSLGCNVIGVYRGEELDVTPNPDKQLQSGNILLLVGSNESVARVQAESARRTSAR